jgi:hypothetical protein
MTPVGLEADPNGGKDVMPQRDGEACYFVIRASRSLVSFSSSMFC